MSTASDQTIQALEQVVKTLPVGTNFALLQLMWAMLNGSFLKSRGAVHSALAESGFSEGEIRRSWRALRYGVWSVDELLIRWRDLVLGDGKWQVRRYEGYKPVAVDITTFWRPRLQGWTGKFFHHVAERMMKGVGLGIVCEVGEVDGQRLPLLKRIIRVKRKEWGEAELKAEILRQAGSYLAAMEVFVHDAGVTLSEVQVAKIERFVIRLATNCTGRRNYLAAAKRQGRHLEYGEKVRPLPRPYKENVVPGTAADEQSRFQQAGHTIQVRVWRGLVRADQKADEKQETFTIMVFDDPRYKNPLVLGTNLPATPETIFSLYLDRWPVEQPPLVAKQMLGLQRQFVFALVSCQRLPELALLVGNILTYLAATLPAVPTGFWDRHPKKHQDGCEEYWPRLIFLKSTRFVSDFEKSDQLQTTYRKEFRLIGG